MQGTQKIALLNFNPVEQYIYFFIWIFRIYCKKLIWLVYCKWQGVRFKRTVIRFILLAYEQKMTGSENLGLVFAAD